MSPGVPGVLAWTFGRNHLQEQWQNRLQNRGWTAAQITEGIQGGQPFPALNQVNPGHSATRYVHPTTERSVLVDDVTSEVIPVGGDGFLY